jgi:acetyl esterase/lipase
MNIHIIASLARLGLVVFTASALSAGEISKPIELWPNGVPDEKGGLGEEKEMTKPGENLVAGKAVIRLGNVSTPTMTVYKPAPEQNTGAAVVVCPGGGYSILAWDLEGTEVCEWLNSIGVTGVLLKYRVPKRQGREKHAAPLQDAQRTLGLIRHRANEFGIDPQRIGILGFSAGGHLSAAVSTIYEHRTYAATDAADAVSCRPDFTILIYPGYLTVKEDGDRSPPELKITEKTPPTFIAMAEDDPVRIENALFYALALKKEKVPVELHVYPTGGHGYGLRPTKNLVTTWPNRVEDWMRSRDLLKKH